MMIPRLEQVGLAKEGYSILKEHMIVYLAMEERTGKSLTAVLIAEMCKNVEVILVVTKKKALAGWQNLIANYSCCKQIHLTTYSSFNEDNIKPDIIIIDEAHNYVAGYPKPSATWVKVKRLALRKPLIYLSATPHAQGYQQLYHQFALSSWSPWSKYSDFYRWFEHYGIPGTMYIGNRQSAVYTKTDEGLCKATTEHLFVTATRKELGFSWEPSDKLHYIPLTDSTKDIYNTIVHDKVIELCGHKLLIDSVTKERFLLHMIEGGVAKHTTKHLNKNGDPAENEHFLVLDNIEKIDYIKKTWGDTNDMVIFYNYRAELIKLQNHFKQAKLLQATAFAEGVELSMYEHLIVYSQDYSTARHTQRRARQASKSRDSKIVVHFLLVKDGVSEQVYTIVSVNKVNFVDSVYQEKYL